MLRQANPPAISIVCPAHNEQENLRPLVQEIAQVMDGTQIEYEIVIVDDGSFDQTHSTLCELLVQYPRLRAARMKNTPRNRGHGQSAAFHAGFRVARGELIAVMDADLQNDPADIPAMLDLMKRTGADLVQGDRSHARADTLRRKFSSWVGRTFRRLLLGDTIRDTGCSLRIMKREVALQLPLHLRGMHRFIPITARHLGFNVVEIKVNHRPRVSGKAKYGMLDRAIPGLIDCLGVRWMRNRRRCVDCDEIK
jgi:dolichol-phosphate mannosyltransferase